MMLDAPTLDRAAGYAASAAMVSLLLAGITIFLFFGGAGAAYGPANDLLVALTLILLTLPVLAIRVIVGEGTGPLFGVLSLLAVVGLAVGAVGQVLLVLGVIDLQSSFVTGGVGILPVLVWAVALAVVAFRTEALPDLVGWTTGSMLVLIVVMIVATSVISGAAVAAGAALLLAVEAWLASIAWTLLGQS